MKQTNSKPIIIPVAGGKGGVGKSFITANLAAALAERGHRTIAIDLDLGASNLHSFLGLLNEHRGIGDFLKARSAELEDMLVETSVPNLSFIPGEGTTPFMANLAHAQKLRLLSRIMKLPADYILLDLAAGTTFNTLDFFRLSSNGLLVTTPEHPSITNMMTFLKNLVLRLCERRFSKNQPVRKLLRSLGKKSITDQQTTITNLVADLASTDPAAAEDIATLCRECRPRVVFNLGEHPDEMDVAQQIDHGLREILSLQVDYFGFVFRDPAVRQSIRDRVAPLVGNSDCSAAGSIRQMAKRVETFWHDPPANTLELIIERAREEYNGIAAV